MNIGALSSRLQALSVQSTYTEETSEDITQEITCVECKLRVVRSATRCNNMETTRINNRPNGTTNNFRVGGLVCILNTYRPAKHDTEVNVKIFSPCYVKLINNNTGATYTRHTCTLTLVAFKMNQ